MPEPIVTPWASPDPPTDPTLERIFRSEGLLARWWSNGPRYRYDTHTHPYHKVLYCVRGSIRFETDGMAFDLAPGDRLDIQPGAAHSALVGGEGVTCPPLRWQPLLPTAPHSLRPAGHRPIDTPRCPPYHRSKA